MAAARALLLSRTILKRSVSLFKKNSVSKYISSAYKSSVEFHQRTENFWFVAKDFLFLSLFYFYQTSIMELHSA